MNYLLQRKTELENEIKSLQPPLWYSQVKRKDELIQELKKVKYDIFMAEHLK